MKNSRNLLATIGFLFVSTGVIAAEDLILGFELGGTLQQAKDHAQLEGWILRPHSADRRQRLWVIEGADATLEVCKDRVFGVTRFFEGGVDEFAALEARVQRSILNWSPTTTIQRLGSGNERISLIDAVFAADDGSRTIVRLRSTNGEVDVRLLTWLTSACSVDE